MQTQLTSKSGTTRGRDQSRSLINVTNPGDSTWQKEITRPQERDELRGIRFLFARAGEADGILDSPLHG